MAKSRRISLLLPEELIEHLKREAEELGIGYQTLIKIKLMEDMRRKRMVEWGTGKPGGVRIKAGPGKTLSEIVIEDRR